MSAHVKQSFAAVLLLGSLVPSASAVDGRSLLIGIGIGIGVYAYQGTRNHVVLPVVHAVQRTVRPIPSLKAATNQSRLRFLFLAAKVWRHAGRVGVSYSDQYAERGLFQHLMDRLRNIAPGEANFAPVLLTPLRS